MSSITTSHQHTHDELVNLKVPLYRYELIKGTQTSQLVGYDLIKQRKCSCGHTAAYDLQREVV